MLKRWASLFFFIFITSLLITSCYQEKSELQKENINSAVIIGCGLSETLSLLKIENNLNFKLKNDIQKTCQAISELKVREDKIYGLCSLSNSLIVYNANSLDVLAEYSIGTGKNPISFCFDESNRIWVSNFISETVEVYELSDEELKLKKTFELSNAFVDSFSRPSGIECAQGKVLVVLSNLDEDFLPAGRSAVAVFDQNSTSLDGIFEISGYDAITAKYSKENGLIYISCAGDYKQGEGFVGNGRLIAFDLEFNKELFSIDVSGAPFEIQIWKNLAIMGNGKEGKILIVDLEKREELAPIDIRQENSNKLSYVSALEIASPDILIATQFNSDQAFLFKLPNFEQLAKFTVCSGPDALVSVKR